MVTTSNASPKGLRDVHYFRQRLKNRVFDKLLAFFAAEAKRTGVTRKDIADRLGKDPAQITRMLSSPSNLTLDTISDFLLALDAEAEPPEIVRFTDRPRLNSMHPLAAKALSVKGALPPPEKAKVTLKVNPRGPIRLRHSLGSSPLQEISP